MTTNKWILLCAFHQKYKATIIAEALDEKEIMYQINDKTDSAFNFLGGVEVYVKQEDFIKAQFIKENLDL